MKPTRSRLLYAVCFALLAGGIPAFATDFFVSPSGSDTNGDGSFGNPWQTIAYAIDRVNPGDALYLRAGIYHEQLITVRDGTSSAPITIAAWNGEAAVIDGEGATSRNGCIIQHSYLRLRGFTVRNWLDDGMSIADCNNLELTTLTVTKVNGGISLKGTVHDFLVDSCVLFDYYGGAGGYGFDATPEGAADRIYNGVVQNCKAYISVGAFDNADGFALGHDGVSNIRFHHCETYGIGDGFDMSGTDIVLTSCSAHNATYGGGYKLWRNNITLVNCIGFDNAVNAELDFDPVTNLGTHARLINCTFHGCYEANVRIERTADGNTLEMVNCILSGGDNTGLNFDGDSISCYRGDYNLFHMNATERAIATSQLDYSLSQIAGGEWTTASGQDAHSRVVTDAFSLFTDTARRLPNLHLRSGAAAINAGTSVSGALTVDFDGSPRGARIDIGAYEYQGPDDLGGPGAHPAECRIEAFYPNPLAAGSGPVTLIYSLPGGGSATLTITDALGRELAVLDNGMHAPGAHIVRFVPPTLPAGMYVCVLRAGATVLARKGIVLR
jgi:hypothetical protein